MEEERKINENTGNMLKQALERRQTERLSSNFSYRMMERVHQEAEKQTKRKTRIFRIYCLAPAGHFRI